VTDSSSLTDTAICTRSSTKGAIVSDIRVVGFAGSLRRASYNRGLIRAAAELAPPGIVVDVFDLSDLPLYNQDVEDAGEPAAVVAFKPLRDKAVAVLGASPGHGSTARAQAQLRDAFVFTGACVMPLPELLVGSAGQHFDDDGNLTDEALRTSLVELVEALQAWTLRIDLRRAAA
jgi:chromate reductase